MTTPTPEQMRALADKRPWTAAEESEWNYQVRAALRAAAAELDRLRTELAIRVIESAPHDSLCNYRIDAIGQSGKCTCWKAEAL